MNEIKRGSKQRVSWWARISSKSHDVRSKALSNRAAAACISHSLSLHSDVWRVKAHHQHLE